MTTERATDRGAEPAFGRGPGAARGVTPDAAHDVSGEVRAEVSPAASPAPVRSDLPDPVAGATAVGPGPASGTGPAEAGTPTPAAEPRSRYSMGSVPNMLRSLLVIGFFVLVLVAIVPRISAVDRPAIDAAGKGRAVAAQTQWPLELPSGLGDGWVPTVATYAAGTDEVPTFTTVWKTPAGADIALKQSAKPTAGWVTQAVSDGVAAGSASVSGRDVERFEAQGGKQLSYVVRADASNALTLVATTSGSEDELKAFLAALRPVAPSAS